jgi:hypothetical protein
MLKTAIGVSDDIDIEKAISDVLRDCASQLDGALPNVGLLFTSCVEADYSMMLQRVLTVFPEIELIGCTTDGEITPSKGFSEDSVALMLMASDTIKFATAIAENISKTPEQSMMSGFAEARAKLPVEPVCAIVLPDGLTTASTALDFYLRKATSEHFPIFGGTAGDHFKLIKTHQFYGENTFSDAMPILLLGGEVDLSASVFTGPIPYGPYFSIDRFEKNVIYEIDGKTTLEFYEQHFGEFNAAFTNFPLAVYTDGCEDFFLRNPFQENHEDGSIAFLGTFPNKCRVRQSQVLREDIRMSAERANKKILCDLQVDKPDLILVFSCTARRHVLGSQTDKEFEYLRAESQTIPFFGFYCYGEIGPFSIGEPTRFHNDTFAALAIGTLNNKE